MKGNIYCIYHNNKICYVGSTIQTLDRRWNDYRSKHANPKTYDYKTKMSTMMREHGFSNFKMELLEKVEVKDRMELFSREGGWMDTFEELGIELYNTNKATGMGSGWRSEEAYQRDLARKRQKVPCEICGKLIARGNMWDHKRTQKCQSIRKSTSHP